METIKRWSSRFLEHSNNENAIARAQRIAYQCALKTAGGGALEPDLCVLCQSINIIALLSELSSQHYNNLGGLRYSARQCPSCMLMLQSAQAILFSVFNTCSQVSYDMQLCTTRIVELLSHTDCSRIQGIARCLSSFCDAMQKCLHD